MALHAPETLFERIVNPVARARGGAYLSLGWLARATPPWREAVTRLLDADGWLVVVEGAVATLFYRADADVDSGELRRRSIVLVDQSHATLAQLCTIDLRSAALEHSLGDRVQRSILANLADVLGTQGVGLEIDLAAYPRIAASVLNYGVELPIGSTASTEALQRFERAVVDAIRRFEPRLMADPLAVEILEPELALAQGVLQMRVKAELKPAYGGDSVRFRTSIDLQTGKTTTSGEAVHAGRTA
jgi:type VI secretion system protein ImpF